MVFEPWLGDDTSDTEATQGAMPSEETMYRTSSPPLEWAMMWTFSQPVFSITSFTRALSSSAFCSTVAQPSCPPKNTFAPRCSNAGGMRPQ